MSAKRKEYPTIKRISVQFDVQIRRNRQVNDFYLRIFGNCGTKAFETPTRSRHTTKKNSKGVINYIKPQERRTTPPSATL